MKESCRYLCRGGGVRRTIKGRFVFALGPLRKRRSGPPCVVTLWSNNRSEAPETGFTIIEVMIAIFILLLGVMGTTTMVDTASKLSGNTKGREGATNLDREIGEDARLA